MRLAFGCTLIALAVGGTTPLVGQSQSKAASPVPVFPAGATVQRSHAMCIAWQPWLEQQQIRDAGNDEAWFEFLRPLIQQGVCQITRGGEYFSYTNEMSFTSDRRTFAFLVADSDRFIWYISPSAYEEP